MKKNATQAGRCVARYLARYLACIAYAPFAAVAANAADYLGRTIGAVLAELRAQGVVVIYTSELLDDSVRIAANPNATGGVELAQEILAAQRLTLRRVGPNTYTVVAAPKVAAVPIQEVVVQASRYTVALDDTATHAVFTQEQVDNLPRLADETLRAAQRLPGVAVNGVSGLGPIRGGASNETAILLDGMRLNEPFHLKNFLSPVSLLDSRLIAGLDIQSGGFTAEFGNSLSGVIEARTVAPQTPHYYELGATVFHVSGLTAQQVGDGHVLLSARRGNLAELSQLTERDFGSPRYADGYARVDYDFADYGRVTLNTLLSRDEIVARRNRDTQRAEVEYRNNYVWSSWERDWSDAVGTNLLAGFTDVTNDRRGQINEPGRRMGTVNDLRDFHIFNIQLSGTWRGPRTRQQLGVELRRATADYRYASASRFEAGFPFPDSPPLQAARVATLSPNVTAWSAYWDGRFTLGKWALQTGLRADGQDYSSTGARQQFNPRLGLLYAPAAGTRLRANFGRYAQAQGVNELQVEDGVLAFNPAQRADHSILALDQQLAPGYDLRIEAYRKRYRR
jgi:hypothetical protein